MILPLSCAAMLIAISLVAISSMARAQCTAYDPSGNFYNLAPACNPEYDYITPPNQNGEVFYLQPCCATIACDYAPAPGPWQTPLCQKDGVGNYHSCGGLNTVVWSFQQGMPVITITGGDNGRWAHITLQCFSGPSKFVAPVLEPGGKLFNATFQSPFACANHSAPTVPPPVSPSPSSLPLCCLYSNTVSQQHTICTSASVCPTLANETLDGDWPVPACSDCFIH